MSTPQEMLEALGREARTRFGRGAAAPGARTYRGRSVEELIPQIQRELGDDAIVLRRREGLTGGMLGFFQRPYVEIEATAAAPAVDVYDEPYDAGPQAAPQPFGQARAMPAARPPAPVQPRVAPAPPPSPAPPLPSASPPRSALSRSAPAVAAYAQASNLDAPASGGSYVSPRLAALARAEPAPVPLDAPVPAPPAPWVAPTPTAAPMPTPAPAADEWRARFQELAPHEPTSALGEQPSVAAIAGEQRTVAPGSHARARAGVARSLRRYGVSEEFAQELIASAAAHALALAPRAGLAQAVRATLAQRIPVAAPLPASGAEVAVVGGGGSGKTACCATLLAAYRRDSSLTASCATVTRTEDGGELEMILSPQVMRPVSARSPRALRALAAARAGGMAVLDTPNVSPSQRGDVRELARLLGELKPDRVVVALPATLGFAAASQLLEALRPLRASALAITHADETDQLGVAVEAACRFALAPEYILERARGGSWRLAHTDPTALAEKLLQ